MTALRFGLIGAGRIGSVYAPVLATCEDIKVVGVVDTQIEPAERIARELDSRVYPDHLALAEAGVDAALICTPPNTHATIALDLLTRGIHVMCEKPLAISVAEAHAMLDAARQSGAVLTMASKFRYVGDVVRARSIVASGILGEIILLENTFASRVEMSNRWNSDRNVAGGGVLIDNGTHSVDIVRFFLGPIAQVMAVEGRRVQSLEVEDTAQVFLRSHDAVRATVDLSWTLDKERDSYLDIYGSEGTVRVGWTDSRFRQSSSPSWVVFGHGYDKFKAVADQLTNFSAAIRGREPLRVTAEDGLASVKVIDAAYASLGAHDWVGVEGPTDPALAR
ncbi:MAG: Gfo/Idh/MocA family oxidoreductase [Acidimicrobiia bacterium]|nr:Gfo/Idh/MocA family oxidoreductase [Acidimicrobiia bacterium]